MEPQSLGRGDGGGHRRLALAGQDVDHDVAADRALVKRLGAGRLHRIKPVGRHRRQDADHLAITIGVGGKASSHPFQGGRQRPVLERRAVPQRTRLARQHRHVMPGVVDRLVTTEPARVLADDLAVLADDDAVGIGMDLDRAPRRLRVHRVFVVVEPHEQRLGDRRRQRMEAVERAMIGDQRRPVGGLEHLPHRPVLELGMHGMPSMGDAAVLKPGVQLLVALEPQPRRKEPLAHQTHLVLDLPLLPPRRRRACHRLD